MDVPSPVSWVFRPDSAASTLSAISQPTYAASASLNKSPYKPVQLHSPSTSQTYTSPLTNTSASPLTPRSSSMHQLRYKASTASPHRPCSLTKSQSAAQPQDLLLPLMPSTEDTKLHTVVSGLRYALQEAQLQLTHSQHQVRLSGSADCFCRDGTHHVISVEAKQLSLHAQH